jgi:hypothetical protein
VSVKVATGSTLPSASFLMSGPSIMYTIGNQVAPWSVEYSTEPMLSWFCS